MRPERVVIVNNDAAKVRHFRTLLEKSGYMPEFIWPPRDEDEPADGHPETFTDWKDVFKTLLAIAPKGFSPKTTDCFVLLDLALDQHDQTFEEGIGQIRSHAASLADYITVALTVWSTPARDRLLGHGIDAVIDTPSTELEDVDRAARILDSGLQRAMEAWKERTGRTPRLPRDHYPIEESTGARAVLAALSQSGIDFLVRQEASGWSEVRVHALTGGFSGAHLVKIEGVANGTPQSIVCKISRERLPLEREMERVVDAMKSYNLFAGNFVPYPDTTPRAIGVGEAWYLVQSNAPGVTVEQMLVASAEPDVDGMAVLVDETRKITALMRQQTARPQSIVPRLALTVEDVDRFTTTSQRLSRVAALCEKRKLLADPLMSDESIRRFAIAIGRWNNTVPDMFGAAPHVAQHGDYNARNIFIVAPRTLGETGRLQLIDFARYGQWPVGYDLTRLEMQVLMRGVDTHSGEEQFPDCLHEWKEIWDAIASADPADRKGGRSPERYARIVDTIDRLAEIRIGAFTDLASSYSAADRYALISLMRTYDGIKMCSYQDTTTFKQLWFLQISMHAAQAAGIEF